MYGYSRLGKTMPVVDAARAASRARQLERRASAPILAGLGCSEATPMPFLAPGDLERAGLPGDGITITNPLVAEESVLRTSLLPGLLKAVRHNVNHRNTTSPCSRSATSSGGRRTRRRAARRARGVRP